MLESFVLSYKWDAQIDVSHRLKWRFIYVYILSRKAPTLTRSPEDLSSASTTNPQAPPLRCLSRWYLWCPTRGSNSGGWTAAMRLPSQSANTRFSEGKAVRASFEARLALHAKILLFLEDLRHTRFSIARACVWCRVLHPDNTPRTWRCQVQ